MFLQLISCVCLSDESGTNEVCVLSEPETKSSTVSPVALVAVVKVCSGL